MTRQAEGEEYWLKYLSDIPTNYKCAVGLILGQVVSQKYHVFHFAKTPPFQTDEDKAAGKPLVTMKNILEINDSFVADHALQATRMLPGGMHVLGVFVVSDEEILNPFNSKLRTLLTKVNKTLGNQNYLFGNCGSEKLIFHYSGKTKRYLAKSYNVASSSITPVDFKFLPKINNWLNFEFKYVIDYLYFISGNNYEGPLNRHIKIILDNINKKLQKYFFLFNDEFKESDERIESINKKKKIPRGSSKRNIDNNAEEKPVQVSIYEDTYSMEIPDKIETEKVMGQIRIIGEVASKLWLNPKTTISEVEQAIKEDIMRSLSGRVDMHWDSLTDEELGENINTVHEPPRRMLITLPDSNISISDYLFPGEGAEDVKTSLEELLDVKAGNELEVLDLEGQADISQYYQETSSPEAECDTLIPQVSTNISSHKYLIGVGTGFLILVISIILHIFLKGDNVK